MGSEKAATIAKLRKELFYLQGLKYTAGESAVHEGLNFLHDSFPGNTFPTGVIHEFIDEDKGATGGFLAGILSALLEQKGVCVWISSKHSLYPPALCAFGIRPDTIIFIELQKEKDLLQAIEESLKCNGLTAVVGEVRELSFTASRRLQLAVEQSRVTGFLLRKQIKNTSVAVARWKISSLPSQPVDDMPGVGFPRWKAELLKVRNGKPHCWQVGWINGAFRVFPEITYTASVLQKKTG
jgi:protein ImuA